MGKVQKKDRRDRYAHIFVGGTVTLIGNLQTK